jgi:hypothetical protein
MFNFEFGAGRQFPEADQPGMMAITVLALLFCHPSTTPKA